MDFSVLMLRSNNNLIKLVFLVLLIFSSTIAISQCNTVTITWPLTSDLSGNSSDNSLITANDISFEGSMSVTSTTGNGSVFEGWNITNINGNNKTIAGITILNGQGVCSVDVVSGSFQRQDDLESPNQFDFERENPINNAHSDCGPSIPVNDTIQTIVGYTPCSWPVCSVDKDDNNQTTWRVRLKGVGGNAGSLGDPVLIKDLTLTIKICDIPVSGNNAPEPDLSINSTECSGINTHNGEVDLTVNNLIDLCDPVSYLWSDGSTTEDITDLCPDTYSVTVSDVLECTSTSSVVVGGSVECCNGPLPVELISISSFLKDKSVVLKWETESETDNLGFDVLRSKDFTSWESLGFVEGQRTTLEKTTYEFEDRIPLYGDNYYRLKQLDFDGQFQYSEIMHQHVKFLDKEDIKVRVFPNPATKKTTVQLTNYNQDKVKISLSSLNGIKVWERVFNSGEMPEFWSHEFELKPNIYLVKIQMKTHTIFKKIIVIN
ncbi:MAG: hypothetical protein ACI9J3_003557 [Parvicellaceae bacterium]|jgi:hypothetical protein